MQAHLLPVCLFRRVNRTKGENANFLTLISNDLILMGIQVIDSVMKRLICR